MSARFMHPVALYRYKLGMTQTRLAAELGVTVREVREMESRGEVRSVLVTRARPGHPALAEELEEFARLLNDLDFQALASVSDCVKFYRAKDLEDAVERAPPLSRAKASALRVVHRLHRPDHAVRGSELGLRPTDLGVMVRRKLIAEHKVPGTTRRSGRFYGTHGGDVRLALYYYWFRRHEMATGEVQRVRVGNFGFGRGSS